MATKDGDKDVLQASNRKGRLNNETTSCRERISYNK
jgi:hypothetical protein